MSHHPMVEEGKEGFLFLANDTNRVLDQVCGTYPLPSDFTSRWAKVLSSRKERLNSLKYPYTFAIAPNKECVYSEFLADHRTFSEDRPVRRVLETARNLGVPALYPLKEMRQISPALGAYPKGDTHWDAPGAFLMYQEIMRSLGLNAFDQDDVIYLPHASDSSDLSGKLGRSTTRTAFRFKNPPQMQETFDNGVTITGNVKHYACSQPLNDLSVMIFHDSFYNVMRHMMAASFSAVRSVWQPNLDYGLINEFNPDIVITVGCERFLVSVPDDQTMPSNAEYVARKKAEGTIGLGKS
jgi:alginate O-acetyltransferase complex protein AlgJ